MPPSSQTNSFIPKKSFGAKTSLSYQSARHSGINIFLAISVFVALITALSAGFVFLWEKTLTSDIASMNERLLKAREAFEPSLVNSLSRLNDRIDSAKKILDNHVSPSPIFGLIEQNTAESVYFNSFEYSLLQNTTPGVLPEVKVVMNGVAKSFNSAAFQSDVFGKISAFKNPLFSNFDLDSSGAVTFNFEVSVDYKNISFNVLDHKGSEDVESNDQPFEPFEDAPF